MAGTKSEYRCISEHAEDLSSGQVLAPGESVKLTPDEVKDAHNKRLIDEGKLIGTDSEPESKKGGDKE